MKDDGYKIRDQHAVHFVNFFLIAIARCFYKENIRGRCNSEPAVLHQE